MPDIERITAKQLMVLDYMRGNGGKLDGDGFAHLIARTIRTGRRAARSRSSDNGWPSRERGSDAGKLLQSMLELEGIGPSRQVPKSTRVHQH